MLLATALLIIGLLLVVYGADRLVFAASILCRNVGIPPIIIGMTVVSIGTSLPEIIVLRCRIDEWATRSGCRDRHRF